MRRIVLPAGAIRNSHLLTFLRAMGGPHSARLRSHGARPSRRMPRVALMWLAMGSAAFAADLFVAPTGDDASPGTEDKPFATLAKARDAARAAGTNAARRIVVLPGDHFLEATLVLDARDSGLTIEGSGGGTATLVGGSPVTGWRRDGEHLWCADLPGVKEGTRDFRALVVNGRMPDRARLPAEGAFLHKSVFDVRWLSSVGGGWEREPTTNELTTMVYDPKDVPATLEPRNAEVRVYHMWDESLVGVIRNDTARQTLVFSPPAKSPPGAFGVKKYAIFNTREGMTRPGQWYLDRAAGRLVYWPLPGEDMAKAKVIAPRLDRVVELRGTSKAPVCGVTLRGLSVAATTTPLKPGGFGAYAFDGAIHVTWARDCVLEGLDVGLAGGQGIAAWDILNCRISGCEIHDIGACGIKAGGAASVVASNHVHHVGRYHPSAIALSVSHYAKPALTNGFRVFRNEVHDAPYSGIVGSGGDHVFEQNLIHRVMQEMQDGGAIYGGMKRCILRGNVVRDVVKMGEGYGVSSYYLDEGAEDCVVERNVSIGVERPLHEHIARNLLIRDNVFVADTNMTLSFARSRDCVLSGNTFITPGRVTVSPPNAIAVWTNNVLFQGGAVTGGAPRAFTIGEAMPAATAPARQAWARPVQRVATPPALDGEIDLAEWPGSLLSLDREPSRWSASGAPAFARVCWDDRCLHVAVNVAAFDVTQVRTGSVWGVDDGAEVCVQGAGSDGKPVAFVLRGYAGGALQSIADGGAPAAAAAALGKAVRFVGTVYGKSRGGWRGEWSIPFEALGLKPEAGLKVPFNIFVVRTQDGSRRCLEGTLAETWRLDEAAVLQLK